MAKNRDEQRVAKEHDLPGGMHPVGTQWAGPLGAVVKSEIGLASVGLGRPTEE